jgi:hypothetical protein
MLTSDINSFLTRWETFSPPLYRQDFDSKPRQYIDSLRPWVNPQSLADVSRRVDNTQIGEVCPWEGCHVASQWMNESSVKGGSNVRFYNGREAYVTVYGAVTYHDVVGNTQYDNTNWNRSYGILLKRSGERWLVTRVAAASNGLLR